MPSYDYTPQQLQRMQQEAAARVREMQRIARARLEQTEVMQNTVPSIHRENPVEDPSVLSPPGTPPSAPNVQPFPSLSIGNLSLDSDKLILLMLIFLLSTQGNCSPSLLAALFWLMG